MNEVLQASLYTEHMLNLYVRIQVVFLTDVVDFRAPEANAVRVQRPVTEKKSKREKRFTLKPLYNTISFHFHFISL